MEAIKFMFGNLELTNEVVNRLEQLGYTPESLKDAIIKHEWKHHSDSQALYCGTYGKCGMWVNISTFDSYEDFENFFLAIHADEEDPEIICQDCENIPDSLYHERIGEEEFEKIAKYCELCDEYNVSAVEDFLEFYKPEYLDMMHDSYVGVYDSEEDFARETVNECYDIEKMMGNLACYFDYEALARDLFLSDYYFGSHGTVFARF